MLPNKCVGLRCRLTQPTKNGLFVSCQLLVGAKHLEDKLSVIAKNSSPNASPVQLSVVIILACSLFPVPCSLSLNYCSDRFVNSRRYTR
ncbi:hypothetical protein FJR08_14600 [Dolichospermum sp. UHCC 0260]|nr:hypothetical protein [Dolichospermum sp. UHCC 0260]